MKSMIVRLAARDVLAAFKSFDLALFLAWEDIRQRYVRTALGPLWIVLSTGVWFGVMGFVMANLFGQQIREYLPFLVSGLLSWILVSSCIVEGTQVLVGAGGLITSFRIPIFTHYIRFVLRNAIIFLHNAIILLIVLAIYPPDVNGYTWMVIPGFLLNLLIATGMAVFLSLANLRYRDTNLAIGSAMQVLPFVTPIYWSRSQLQHQQWIADVNPFYHMVEIMRQPMLGHQVDALSWEVTIGLALVITVYAAYLFSRYRHRIIFWL